MTRPILLSNGYLHVGINLFGMVHELYYPHVGSENHSRASNMRHRIGVWTEGQFSWLDDGSWMFAMDYAHHAQVGHITASNANLGITLELLDCVATDDNAFLRNIHIINASNKRREIRLFMGQAFLISSSFNGDTAQYLPDDAAILHFKGRRNFVVGGKDQSGRPFSQHAVGLFGIEGKLGTYVDAEDGTLGNTAVEFGKVDSVIGFTSLLAPYDSTHIEYWLVAGTTRWSALDLHKKITKVGIDPFFDHTMRHWHRWLGPAERFIESIDKDLQAPFRRSMLVLASQLDHDGSVMASTDTTLLNYQRDSYAYCWPRDASYALWPLLRLGYKTELKNFFDFCVRALHPDGYLLQKFSPDAAPGSTWHPYVFGDRVIPPIQEDETAAVIHLLAAYIERNNDKESLHKYYESLVAPAANFMASYIDEKTKLPHASYDLWEEKFLTTTYTTALTYAALCAAARMAEKMRRPKDAVRWQTVADDMPEAAAKFLFNKEAGYFYKGFVSRGKGLEYDDSVDTSSFYGAYAYGLFAVDSPQLKKSMKTLERIFHLKEDEPTIMQRYEHDQYFTVDPAGLGNPWFVTSLWIAEYDMLTGKAKRAKKTIEWVRSCMLSTGVLAEQVNPFTHAFTSVAPLTWSQAEFLNSIIDFYQTPGEPDHA